MEHGCSESSPAASAETESGTAGETRTRLRQVARDGGNTCRRKVAGQSASGLFGMDDSHVSIKVGCREGIQHSARVAVR